MSVSARSFLALPLAALWLAVLPSGPSRASCVASDPAIAWSFPADGASDVPTDANLWFITSLGPPPHVFLNGVELPAAVDVGDGDKAIRWAPGPLTPDTTYEVTLTFRASDGWSLGDISEVDRTLTFRTGAGAASDYPSAFPPLEGTALSDTIVGHPCEAILRAQECFDTGTPRLVTLSSPDAPLIWVVRDSETQLSWWWPAECGDPSVPHRSPGPLSAGSSFDVVAIGADGTRSAQNTFALVDGPYDDAGCSAGEGPARGMLTVLLLALLRLARSRRRSS